MCQTADRDRVHAGRRGVGRCACRRDRFGIRRRRLAGRRDGQRIEPGDDMLECRVIRLALCAIGVDLALEHVATGEKHVHRRAVEHQFAVSRAIEQILQPVGGVLQTGETEGARPALDRMRRAEDRVELFAVRGRGVERNQQTLHLVEQLVGLVEEGLVELGDVDTHGGSGWRSRGTGISERAVNARGTGVGRVAAPRPSYRPRAGLL